jgi:hypothetical protein
LREVQFDIPFDVPKNTRAKWEFKAYLSSLVPQLGVYGQESQDVGFGFVWRSRTGLPDFDMATLSRRMRRALRATGILSGHAEVYHLEQRIKYIRDGEPSAIFTLREGVKEE